MGDVYRARDTTLGRDVAINVVADAFLSDPERLARFEREARVLATLNHPHVGAIYGLEETDPSPASGQPAVRAPVLELVEGKTLPERLAAGRLPIQDALRITHQIADGGRRAGSRRQAGGVVARRTVHLVSGRCSRDWKRSVGLPLFGDRKPLPFLQTRFNEATGRFSPDGRWIVYESNESASNEVYRRAVPRAGRHWQVSAAGRSGPQWGRDGKEIFYLGLDNKADGCHRQRRRFRH